MTEPGDTVKTLFEGKRQRYYVTSGQLSTTSPLAST